MAGKATASVVAQRLIGTGVVLATLLGGTIILLIQSLLSGMILGLILFLATIMLVLFALPLILCFREGWTFRIVDRLISFVERAR